ncbi:MAG: hypothetical protein K9W45_10945 [Candidatus Heimdallarchaeum aukensis]|uniref:Uncharacterized protein n=1 Tax=Candidatus Heimdallarchaeum aukensis TaxID=2876573 RepID=A0A9Y1FKK4_9ARCH|nr:MAG: hypothetical protein K9W45_10945 [Candidatus Heimdallarchaeum aukensis]
MNNCKEFDELIVRPSSGDKTRKQAMRELIKNGCVSSLYHHALTFSRIDWIRNYALLSLVKIANLTTMSADVAVTIRDEEIIFSDNVDIKKIRNKAARYLFLFVLTPKKPSKFKKIALMGLLAGEYWDYCDELLNDQEVENWVKQTILKYKKNKSKKI